MTDLEGRAGGKLSSSYFSTEGLPSNEGFRIWKESILPLFEATSAGLDRFHAQTEAYDLGTFVYGFSTATAQQFQRSYSLRERDCVDHLLLQLYLEGGYRGRNGQQDMEVQPGDVSLIDLGRNIHTQTSDFACLSLIIPRDLFLPYLGKSKKTEGVVIKGASPLGRILSNQLREFWQLLPTLDMVTADRLSRMLVEVLGIQLKSAQRSFNEEEGPFSQATISAIDAYINQHLDAEDMGVDRLCHVFKCSRSYLYRLFRSRGGVAIDIQRRRLANCYHDLCKSGQRIRRVGEIACRWGFKSQAHFARLFKEAYGLTPTEAMMQAKEKRHHEAELAALSSDLQIPIYRNWLLNL